MLFNLLSKGALALAFAAVAVSAVPGSVDSPNTPADGTPIGNEMGKAEKMCLLKSLTFTNNFNIVGDFKQNVFNYECSCLNMGSATTTTVVPLMEDPGSSAEITFNGVKKNFRSTNNAISNGGQLADSPNTASDLLTLQDGKTNTIVVGVGCNGMGQPETCYYQYTISCMKPGGFVVGDPQFVGLRGQSYQVHGVSGEVYNIVSDKDLQYNSRFVFLSSGKCPVVSGKKLKGCWSHSGSYLGELGLKTRAGDKITVVSGSAKHGFNVLQVNGKDVEEGETVVLKEGLGHVSRNSTHLATLQIGSWDFAFENSDMFVNQRVRVLDARTLRSHGLLGQTWREATYPNAIKYIQGEVDDYVIRDGSLFGDNFVFNSFN